MIYNIMIYNELLQYLIKNVSDPNIKTELDK